MKPVNKSAILNPSAKLAWDIDDYIPSVAAMNRAGHSEADMRREYSRLRAIALKRLKRIGTSEFKDTKTYKNNIDKYPTLKELSKGEIAAALTDVARFVHAKTGSLTGLRVQREKALESMAEHGYTGVNRENIKAYGEFMEQFHAEIKAKLYDSKRIYEAYMFGKKHEIKTADFMKNFETWYKYSEILDKVNVKFTDKTDADLMLSEFEEALKKM